MALYLVKPDQTPAPWPEQPSRTPLPVYSVPPIPQSHHRLTEPGHKLDLYRSLEDQSEGGVDRRYRARLWLAMFGVTILLAVCAVAFVAGREQSAGHVAEAVNG